MVQMRRELDAIYELDCTRGFKKHDTIQYDAWKSKW